MSRNQVHHYPFGQIFQAVLYRFKELNCLKNMTKGEDGLHHESQVLPETRVKYTCILSREAAKEV